MPFGGEALQNDVAQFSGCREVVCGCAVVRAGNTCESFNNFTRHALDIAGEQVSEDALTVFTVGAAHTASGGHKVFRELKVLLLDTLTVYSEVFVASCIELPGEFRGCFAHVVGGGKPAYERARIFHGQVEVLTESLLQTRGEPCIPEPGGNRTSIEHVLDE